MSPTECLCGHDAGSHDRTVGHCRRPAGAGPLRVTGVCPCPKFQSANEIRDTAIADALKVPHRDPRHPPYAEAVAAEWSRQMEARRFLATRRTGG